MRYAQTVRIALGSDRKRTDASDVYVTENAVINLGNTGDTLTWNEIKDSVDFMQNIINSQEKLIEDDKTVEGTSNRIAYLINRTPGIDTTTYFIINDTTEDVKFKKENDNINSSSVIFRGGQASFSGEHAEIVLSDVDSETRLNNESCTIKDTNNEDQLNFDSEKLEIKKTNDSESLILKLNSIQFKTIVQTPSISVGAPLPAIAGVVNNLYRFVEIVLDSSIPIYKTCPEYKLTISVNKGIIDNDALRADYITFTMMMNIGEWFSDVPSFTEINVDSFKTDSERIIYSNNIPSVGDNLVFYKREGTTINIAWIPDDLSNIPIDAIEYTLIQVA